MYLFKWFIAPAIHLFINRYSHATAHHSPIIYLQSTLSVKIHKEAGETLMHSVLHFLHSLITPCFDCIHPHQHCFIPSLWLPCRPDQSGNSWQGAHIPLLLAVRILRAMVLLYIWFNVHHAIVFADIRMIEVPILVKPIFSVRNGVRCAILFTFAWMTFDCSDWADI